MRSSEARQRARQERIADPRVRWPRQSPDKRYAFEAVAADRTAPTCSITLTDQHSGEVLLEFQSLGRFHYGKWRRDGRAFVFEQRLPTGKRGVTLLIIGDGFVQRREIQPHELLPDQWNGLPHHWENHVQLLGWRSDGGFQISWTGSAATQDGVPAGGRKNYRYQCRIALDPDGELSMTQATPNGRTSPIIW